MHICPSCKTHVTAGEKQKLHEAATPHNLEVWKARFESKAAKLSNNIPIRNSCFWLNLLLINMKNTFLDWCHNSRTYANSRTFRDKQSNSRTFQYCTNPAIHFFNEWFVQWSDLFVRMHRNVWLGHQWMKQLPQISTMRCKLSRKQQHQSK